MLYYTMCFFASEEVRNVSILIVLDDTLVPANMMTGQAAQTVSILIVLDDALVQVLIISIKEIELSLNPCCAGRCSSTCSKCY